MAGLSTIPAEYHKIMRPFERLTKKYVDQKMSMFNQICINEEMLPIYIYIYIYKGVWN